MTTLIIATRNAHKVDEIRAILGPNFCYLTLADFPEAPEVVEDAGTFAGNATKKAAGLANWLSCSTHIETSHLKQEVFVMADDSGLEVDALNGAPGVHSARFAAMDTGQPGNSSTAENNAKLLRLMSRVPQGKRAARFKCVIALIPVSPARPTNASPVCAADEQEFQAELFEGTCEGQIDFLSKGKGGFGYDPLFIPDGYVKTFSELPEETKNRFSHRANALLKLKRRLTSSRS